MEVTKPYEFIGFGAMEVTKAYKFIGLGAVEVTKAYKFTRFGAMEVTKPYEYIWFGSMEVTKHGRILETALARSPVARSGAVLQLQTLWIYTVWGHP